VKRELKVLKTYISKVEEDGAVKFPKPILEFLDINEGDEVPMWIVKGSKSGIPMLVMGSFKERKKEEIEKDEKGTT